jgi:hypothetical protein
LGQIKLPSSVVQFNVAKQDGVLEGTIKLSFEYAVEIDFLTHSIVKLDLKRIRSQNLEACDRVELMFHTLQSNIAAKRVYLR